MRKKTYPSAMVGTSFMLVIFIILALVSFATISLVSAKADNKLSLSMAETVVIFYDGQTEAHKTLEEIDEKLTEIYQNVETEQAFNQQVKELFEDKEEYNLDHEENLYLSYETKISDDKILNSRLEITYPTNEGKGFYQILEWNTINIVPWEPTSEMPVFLID